MVRVKTMVNAQVKRGRESWNYIYVFLGFALAIEGIIIDMLHLDAASSLTLYTSVGALTWYRFLHDGWFQNKLTGWKASYEEKWR